MKHHHCKELEKKTSDNALVQRNKLSNSCLCVGFIAPDSTKQLSRESKHHHCKELEKKKKVMMHLFREKNCPILVFV